MVGLVEHDDLDLAEVEAPLLDEVFDAARGADDDVDAALQGSDLAALGHTAVDLRREETHTARDGLHGAVDLQRELAGRREDERARGAAHLTVLAAAVLHEALDERGSEGDGLARARAAAAEHIFAREHVGNRRRLDRERRNRTEVFEGAGDVVAETEIAERDALDIFRDDGVGTQALKHDVVDLAGLRVAARVEARLAALGA